MHEDRVTSDTGPESTSGFFAGLLGWLDRYSKLKRFLATRRAIREGQLLVDLSPGELKQRDLMGPLSFNVYESTLAGLPSLVITTCIGILFPLAPTDLPLNPQQTEFQRSLLIEIGKITPSLVKTVSPFLAPLILLWSSYVMGRASLESFDSNAASRRRSRNGFLYFDGAYGLLAQTLVATAIGLGLVAYQYGWDTAPLLIVIAVFGLCGTVLQYRLILSTLKRLQFNLNGYHDYGAPDSRYLWAFWVFNPISVWLLFALVYVAMTAAAVGIAFLRVWLRFHIGHSG